VFTGRKKPKTKADTGGTEEEGDQGEGGSVEYDRRGHKSSDKQSESHDLGARRGLGAIGHALQDCVSNYRWQVVASLAALLSQCWSHYSIVVCVRHIRRLGGGKLVW
jgi:hypothetical protein